MSGPRAERLHNPFRPATPARVDAAAPPLRPMTGYEEEFVECHRHVTNTAALCNQVIARCMCPPGADASDALAQVRSMTVAQRDAALILVRRLSYGDLVRCRVTCPSCSTGAQIEFHLSSLPVAYDSSQPRIELEVAGLGHVVLRTANAGDQEALLDASPATDSERRSLLLSRVLLACGGREAPFDVAFTRGLNIAARHRLEEELERAAPSWDLTMAVDCPGCGAKFRAPFDVASFFLTR